MIKTLFGSMALTAAVFAVDAAAAAAGDWSGCLAGISSGHNWAQFRAKEEYLPNQFVGSATATGGFIGGQLGCDYQVSDWVMGLQVGWSAADIEGKNRFINGTSASDFMHYDVKWFGSVSARVGYLFTPDALLYLRGGAVAARTIYHDTDPTGPVPYSDSAKVTRNGMSVGAGVEYRVFSNLSGFVEYNYMDFDKKYTVLRAVSPPDAFKYSFRQDMHNLSVGLNYRF